MDKIYIAAAFDTYIKMQYVNEKTDSNRRVGIEIKAYNSQGTELDSGFIETNEIDDLRLHIEEAFAVIDRPIVAYILITENEFNKATDGSLDMDFI